MNKSSDDRQHQPVVAAAETHAAQAVPERNNPPVAAATANHPPSDQSLGAPSEHLAILVRLRVHVAREISEARRGKYIYAEQSLWNQYHFTDGQEDALIGVLKALKRIEAEESRGGNGAGEQPESPLK